MWQCLLVCFHDVSWEPVGRQAKGTFNEALQRLRRTLGSRSEISAFEAPEVPYEQDAFFAYAETLWVTCGSLSTNCNLVSFVRGYEAYSAQA